MKVEQLSNADRQMIIEKYHQFEDNRPLTNETLVELGFEYIPLPFNSSFRIGSSFHHKYNFFYIPTNGEVIKYVQFLPTGIKYKTVGGIKLLLEALKGDE